MSEVPAIARTSVLKARTGLSAQLDVHDQQQVEMRYNYSLRDKHGAEKYAVDVYMFLPRAFGVNPQAYPKAQFYQDVTALMRLDSDPLALEELANHNNRASPLFRIHQSLARFRAEPRPPASAEVVAHVKLYAHLFTQSVRRELRLATKALRRKQGSKKALSDDEKELALRATLGRIEQALRAFRSTRAAFWPFERIGDVGLAETLRSADEYMSVFLDQRLAEVVAALEHDMGTSGGVGFVARTRLILVELAAREGEHRRRHGYMNLTTGSLSQGEYFTFRWSLLKKTIQQALYLSPREVARDQFVANAAAGVAAALAAIWALATQVPQTLSHLPLTTKVVVFAGAVAAYVLKDRLKANLGPMLAKRFLRYDHTSTLGGAALSTVGLSMLQAQLKEVMHYAPRNEVPSEVLALRMTGRTVNQAALPDEEIIHYRKVLDVRSLSDVEPLPEGYWVRDIMRLNVRHFLVRLDDPDDSIRFFDVDARRFAEARLPKVYHLNIVAKITRVSADGSLLERYERWRVILNKLGVVRVETMKGRSVLHESDEGAPRTKRWVPSIAP